MVEIRVGNSSHKGESAKLRAKHIEVKVEENSELVASRGAAGLQAIWRAVSSRPPGGLQQHLGRVRQSLRLIGAGESDKVVETKTALMELGLKEGVGEKRELPSRNRTEAQSLKLGRKV